MSFLRPSNDTTLRPIQSSRTVPLGFLISNFLNKYLCHDVSMLPSMSKRINLPANPGASTLPKLLLYTSQEFNTK